MVAIRTDVAKDPVARAAFVDGINGLKAEAVTNAQGGPVTTADLGIPGAGGVGARPLSTYDLFVLWHYSTMMTPTPRGAARNAAHQGPVFLPWHRLMLMLLEANIARVLGRPTFGLPYWDWAQDGELSPAAQPTAVLWTAPDGIGGDGDAAGEVQDGPFWAATTFRIAIESDGAGNIFAVDRPLRRRLRSVRPQSGGQRWRLPRQAAVRAVLDEALYDSSPWDSDARTPGFRNGVEGWQRRLTAPPDLHNLVHVWIGGDMAPATSPNDPVFYLNHCNVDRIWAAWQAAPGNRTYLPRDTEPAALFRHRTSDPLLSPYFRRDAAGTPWLVSDMFDVSAVYTYDSLDVAG